MAQQLPTDARRQVHVTFHGRDSICHCHGDYNDAPAPARPRVATIVPAAASLVGGIFRAWRQAGMLCADDLQLATRWLESLLQIDL